MSNAPSKQIKKCASCNLNTEPGRSRCRVCAEKVKQHDRERYQKRSAAGVCVLCGREVPIDGKTSCERCLSKYRKRYEAAAVKKKTEKSAAVEKKTGRVYGERESQWHKKRYAERKAAGLCGRCGYDPVEEGFAYCTSCLRKQRHRQIIAFEKMAAEKERIDSVLAEQRIDAGLCRNCGSSEVREAGLCRGCRSIELVRGGMKRYAARKLMGLCQCCNALAEQVAWCRSCYERRKRDKARQQRNRVCVGCGQPNDSGTSSPKCRMCHTKEIEAYHRKRENRLCTKCGKNGVVGDKYRCEECKDKLLARDRKKNQVLRDEILSAYGNKCQCCGETTQRFLSVDHVNNDGAEHRRQENMQGGQALYRWLRDHDFPKEGFQLLCFNCNLGKAQNGGICPHQQKPPLTPDP